MAHLDEASQKGITPSEQKELRRVFDYLADYLPKKKIYEKLNPLLDRKQKLEHAQKSSYDSKLQDDSGNSLTEAQIEMELGSLDEKIEKYNAKISEYDSNSNRKIHANDLSAALLHLGKKCSKREIQDMIWEVDENLDGCVDWEEFRLMFQRNILVSPPVACLSCSCIFWRSSDLTDMTIFSTTAGSDWS